MDRHATTIRRMLGGRTIAQFALLSLLDRRALFRQNLVQQQPVFIEEADDDDSLNPDIADGVLLRQQHCMGKDETGKQLVKEACDVYYGENHFNVRLHWLCEFMTDTLSDYKTKVPVAPLIKDSITVIVDSYNALGTAIDAAARYDLAALSSMYGMFSGMFVAMALLKKGHAIVDEKLEPVVSGSLNPFLGALVPYNGLIARSWDDKAWDDNLGNPIGMQAQALRNILEACRDDGMDDGFLKNLTTAMERVVKDRGENGGIAVIGEYLLNGRLTNE
ncbi:hypothetical protein IWW34DRAFT_751879 [Fusarium oxysporum f. sp. albedinis]|nr:hypothetical protein IWW34DRAFT_751879 [Fusarium oxysporum f. sp. albedinis]KAK2468222.1 hypothetical protein H9L39_19868 [Fusarium oxysporum f. sp. albedinis]